jgi:predicted membrane protein
MAAGQLSSFFFSAATLQLGSILKPAVDIFGTMTAFAWWGFTFLASVVIIVALVLFLMPQPHITPKLVSCLSQTLFVVGFTGFPLVFIGITAGAVYRYKQGDKISSKIGSKYHNISHNEKKKLYNKMKNGEVHENEDNEQNVNSAEFIHFINTFSDYIFTSAPDLLDKPYGFEHYISKIFPN